MKNEPEGVLPHLVYATAATISAHPFRVLLTQATIHRSPLATIQHAMPVMFHAVKLNTARGISSVTASSYGKTLSYPYVAKETYAGKIASATTASLASSCVAATLETPFIRQSLRALNQPRHLYPFAKFSPALFGFYFVRDVGFCSTVFCSRDFSLTTQYAMLFGASGLTAACQRLASIEAAKDIISHQGSVPDYRQGLRTVIKSLARGDVYTHPVFKVPYQDPSSLTKKMANVFSVTCGPNVFLFRLTYMFAFGEAYHLSVKGVAHLNRRFGLFSTGSSANIDQPQKVSSHGPRT